MIPGQPKSRAPLVFPRRFYEQSAAALLCHCGSGPEPVSSGSEIHNGAEHRGNCNGRQTREERDGSGDKPASLAWFSGCWRSLSFYEHYALGFIIMLHDAKSLGSNQELSGLNPGVSSPLGNPFSFLFSWFIIDRAPRELTRSGPDMTSTRISDVGLMV